MAKWKMNLLGICVIGFVSLLANLAQSADWHPVKDGKPFGISGMALIDHTESKTRFLIVHDNKKKNQGRLAVISITHQGQPDYMPIKWPDDSHLPIDLEGLTRIPGQSDLSYLALTSNGEVFHIKLKDPAFTVEVVKIFSLPDVAEEHNLEGLDVQMVSGELVATWAHRGRNDDPAIIFWAEFDLPNYEITNVNSAPFSVPWPFNPDVRHISDMKIDESGVLLISAASDPNNEDGPFQSAIYIAGAFSVQPEWFFTKKIVFQKNDNPTKLFQFNKNKIEALELISGKSGGIFLGTDDENRGASLYIP